MTNESSCGVCKVVGLLVGLGALNLGLAGVFGLDLVARMLGGVPAAATVVYAVIGVAGLAKLISLVKACPCCRPGQTCGSQKS